VDAPPRAPEDLAIPANGFFRPTSNSNNGVLSVTVTGTLTNVMRFFNRVNISPILMVVGTLKLDSASGGTTPGGTGGFGGPPGSAPAANVATGEPNQITATFTLTPYLLAAGPGVTLTAGGAAAATGAAPGVPPTGPPATDQ
jgi:hypothetical protein